MDPGMVKNLALGAIPPGILVGAVLLLMWWRAGRRTTVVAGTPADDGSDRAGWREALTPLVMAAGVLLGYLLVFGAPTLKPVRSIEWFPLIAVAAAVAGAVVAMDRLPALVRLAAAAGAAGFAGWASAKNKIGTTWSVNETAGQMVEFIVWTLAALVAAHLLFARRTGLAKIAVLMIIAGGASQLIVLGLFSTSVGQVAGMPVAGLGAALAAALLRPRLRIGAGAVVFVVVMVQAALMQGKLYGTGTPEMARLYSGLVMLALVGACLIERALPERTGPRVRAVVAGVVAAGAIGAAMSAAVAERARVEESPAGEGEYDPYSGARRSPHAPLNMRLG